MHYDPDLAAQVCYAAVRQYRIGSQLDRGPVWGLLVREEQSWWIKAAQRAWMGMRPREIFEAWADDLAHGDEGEDNGWVFGSEVNHDKRTHPWLTDWHSLPEPAQRQYYIIQMNSVGLATPIAAD